MIWLTLQGFPSQVIVNMALVKYFEPSSEDRCALTLVDGTTINVVESQTQMTDKLARAIAAKEEARA